MLSLAVTAQHGQAFTEHGTYQSHPSDQSAFGEVLDSLRDIFIQRTAQNSKIFACGRQASQDRELVFFRSANIMGVKPTDFAKDGREGFAEVRNIEILGNVDPLFNLLQGSNGQGVVRMGWFSRHDLA